jgi:predicted AAA+ superfamily ATPase
MRFGLYPEVLSAGSEKRETLLRLVNGNLYKDVLAYRGVKKPMLVVSLLKLLAHQVGNEVSYSELALRLGADKETVMSYISLLEQAFIVFRLPPLTNNKRREVSRLHKIYFWDVGIRNAIIGAFDEMSLRGDAGAVFENFFIAEKLKRRSLRKEAYEAYFWRTKAKQEVDFVEEYNGGASYVGYECKIKKQAYRKPTEWTLLYPEAPITLVYKDVLLVTLDASV